MYSLVTGDLIGNVGPQASGSELAHAALSGTETPGRLRAWMRTELAAHQRDRLLTEPGNAAT
jgi:hypothetical protein